MNRLTRRQTTAMLAAASACLALMGQARAADDYAEMLGYLAQTRIDGQALAGSSGVIAVNMASGDLNQQANLHALAVGGHATTSVHARQRRSGDVYDAPREATARIGGSALSGASGIASINQASGSANAEHNAVAVVLADQGMREASDGQKPPVGDFAPAERQRTRYPAGKTAIRNVAVEATALSGFQGVLQLNQIAGSANATGNQFRLSIAPGP